MRVLQANPNALRLSGAIEQFEHGGRHCEIVINGMGFYCGYVFLPFEHPLAMLGTDELSFISVHGGVTCSRKFGREWMIGFDCQHIEDAPANKAQYGKADYENIWDVESVAAECRGLVDDIAACCRWMAALQYFADMTSFHSGLEEPLQGNAFSEVAVDRAMNAFLGDSLMSELVGEYGREAPSSMPWLPYDKVAALELSADGSDTIARDVAGMWRACGFGEGGLLLDISCSRRCIDAEKDLSELAEILGVSAMRDAYCSGVPIEDVLARR